MSRRLGFKIDLRGCTGCKACQVACKDKHGLAPGVLWRRVAEVAGGGWAQEGEAWREDSRSWFVTIACMHCEEPICVEVCPTKAMAKDGEHGIVAVDPDRCMGCQYCAWACPYGAPQFDPSSGVMTKCDLCRDRLAENRAPACVAACPTRVLGVEDAASRPSGTAHGLFPLPDPDLTKPVCAFTLHRDAEDAAPADLHIGNGEEIERRANPGKAEWPLVLYTVLAQAAAGLCVADVALRWFFPEAVVPGGLVLGVAFALVTSCSLIAAAHLGRARAVRFVLAHLGSSWLSREALATGALVGVTLLGVVLTRLGLPPGPWDWVAAVLGVLLVITIARVYRLRTVPAWNTWATPAAFFGTAYVLGAAALALLLASRAEAPVDSALRALGVTVAILVVLQLFVLIKHLRNLAREPGAAAVSARAILGRYKAALARRCVYALVSAGILLACTGPGHGSNHAVAIGVACALLLASEFLGRFLFYASHRRTGL